MHQACKALRHLCEQGLLHGHALSAKSVLRCNAPAPMPAFM